MSPEKQRIAIAELCGWKHRDGGMWYMPDDSTVGMEVMPDYLNDLNAIHQAVMSLSNNQRDLVNLELSKMTSGNFDYCEMYDLDCLVNATATQRSEALLRAMGQWKDK